jgi:hypothetical protein
LGKPRAGPGGNLRTTRAMELCLAPNVASRARFASEATMLTTILIVILILALVGALPFEGRVHDILVAKQQREASRANSDLAGRLRCG